MSMRGHKLFWAMTLNELIIFGNFADTCFSIAQFIKILNLYTLFNAPATLFGKLYCSFANFMLHIFFSFRFFVFISLFYIIKPQNRKSANFMTKVKYADRSLSQFILTMVKGH